jgi:hypothetical protein
MNITMQNIERLTLDQIREFVEGSRTIGFSAPKGEAVYEFIERVLKSQQYRRLGRGQKGIVRRFLVKMTGLSRAQLTRWIGRWIKTGVSNASQLAGRVFRDDTRSPTSLCWLEWMRRMKSCPDRRCVV